MTASPSAWKVNVTKPAAYEPYRVSLNLRAWDLTTTWTPKVCKIMAFMATFKGLGLLFYIPLGFR